MDFNSMTPEEKKLFYGEATFDFDSMPIAETETTTIPSRAIGAGLVASTPVLGNAMYHKPVQNFLQRFVISHNNRYKTVWDTIIMLFVIYSSFSTAYILAFDINSNDMPELSAFEIFIDVCFYIDIILFFFQEYRDPQSFECIRDLRLIAKNYIKSWFIIDLLAVLPFQRFGYDPFLQLLRILRLPRLLKFLDYSKVDRILHSLLENTSSKNKMNYMYASRYIYKVVRLILVATILTYFLGCLWYFIITETHAHAHQEENFFTKNELFKYSRVRRLIVCCYFILTTLTTVGYGDYTPITSVEKTLSIVIMILGIALFSYIISSFNDVVSAHDKQMGIADYSTDLHKWLKSLTRFTDNEPLPCKLIDDITEHFQFFWKNNRLANLSYDDNYLQKMPKGLQYRLIQYMFDDVFSLFRGFFHINEFRDSPFYYELAFSFLPCKFDAGEFILKPEQLVEEVYLIKEGSVYIYTEYQGKTVGKCFGKGYFFGANNIFRNAPAQFYYRAIKGAESCTKVIAISKSKMLKLLNDYPQILAVMAQSAKTNDNSLRNMIKTELKLLLKKLGKPYAEEDINTAYEHCIPKPRKTFAQECKRLTTISASKLEEAQQGLLEREEKINQKLNQVKKFKDQLGDDMEDILSELRKVKDVLAKKGRVSYR